MPFQEPSGGARAPSAYKPRKRRFPRGMAEKGVNFGRRITKTRSSGGARAPSGLSGQTPLKPVVGNLNAFGGLKALPINERFGKKGTSPTTQPNTGEGQPSAPYRAAARRTKQKFSRGRKRGR